MPGVRRINTPAMSTVDIAAAVVKKELVVDALLVTAVSLQLTIPTREG